MRGEKLTNKVQITIPGDLAWQLWGIAEREGKPVGEVIRDALNKKPEQVPDHARETHMRIVAMVRAGMDDGTISTELGRVRGYVADVRRRYGLEPNKRKKVAA